MKRNEKKPVNRGPQSKRNTSDSKYASRKSYSPKNTGGKHSERNEEAVLKEKEVTAKDLHNDPNWYFTNPEVAKQAGELSFQQFLGVENTFGGYTMPTIMTLACNPSPGNTYPGGPSRLDGKSGFNMSMTRLFNRLSMKSGRNMAYAPQDVGMAILGMGEVLSMISYVRRIFGVSKWWNVRNRMVPKKVIKAMGIDPDDFFKYYSDYRMRVNTLIMAFNQIPILTNSGYLRKCAAMYDNIYIDCSASMSQYYIFVPWSTWILDETSDPRGTVCATKELCAVEWGAHATPVMTMETFIDEVLQPMVQAMLHSSTLNLVYADIMNLNKTEDLQLATIDIISEEYAVVPVHDELVLKQIHNATAMGSPSGASEADTYTKSNDVVCDPNNNSIKYSPLFNNRVVHTFGTSDPRQELGTTRLIDTDTSDPDLVEKIEITRYVGSHANSFASGALAIYSTIPDHYVSFFTIYTDDIDDTHAWTFASDWFGTGELMTDQQHALLSQFDWHPIIYHYNNDGNAFVNWVTADLNAFTVVNNSYLQRLNGVIYMDLFDLR